MVILMVFCCNSAGSLGWFHIMTPVYTRSFGNMPHFQLPFSQREASLSTVAPAGFHHCKDEQKKKKKKKKKRFELSY